MKDWRFGVAIVTLALLSPGTAPASSGERVSPQGRPKGEHRSAQHEGAPVTFASPASGPATGESATIGALLFRPADMAPGERRPAIVALHGCGGMYSAVKARREVLSVRHQTMADLLTAEGYVVLFPDSFRSRGVEEICTTKARERTVTVTGHTHKGILPGPGGRVIHLRLGQRRDLAQFGQQLAVLLRPGLLGSLDGQPHRRKRPPR